VFKIMLQRFVHEIGKFFASITPLEMKPVHQREGEQKSDEGCLSIPEFTDTILRPARMVVRGQDLHGDEIRIEAEGLLARCFSHEIDHLNGILFVDHLSSVKKNLVRNKIKKLAKTGQW